MDGFKAFDHTLTRIEAVMKDPKYLQQAGEYVLSAAKMRCAGFRVSSGELRNSLNMVIRNEIRAMTAHIGTNKAYAAYVEFGTGPRGAADHNGISPEVAVSYTLSPWWIHESMIDPGAAAVYGWAHIDTPSGRFYHVSGQPAHPYLYPAFRDNAKVIQDILAGGFEKAAMGG